MKIFEVYRGWNPTHLCGDYFINHHFKIPIFHNQYFNSKSPAVFFWLGRLLTYFLEPEMTKKIFEFFGPFLQVLIKRSMKPRCARHVRNPCLRICSISAMAVSPDGTRCGLGLVPCWCTGIGLGGSMVFFFSKLPTKGSLERSQNSCILNHFPSKWKSEEPIECPTSLGCYTSAFTESLGRWSWLITSLREMFEKSMSVNYRWLILWQIILQEFIFKLLFTCLPYTICPPSRHFWVDDFPFPRVGYVSSLEGNLFPPNSRPQVLVRLETLPRNSNGKIDRAKLLWLQTTYILFEYAVMMVYEHMIYI